MPIAYTGDHAEFDGMGLDISAARIRGLLHGSGLERKTTMLTVCNVAIVDGLDLESAELPITTEFRQCTFRGVINLEQAKAKALYFVGCDLRGIVASQLQTTFNFVLDDCTDSGGITLTGAHVGGQVSFRRTRLYPSTGDALAADGLIVDQDLTCSDGFEAHGPVRLIGSHICGQFACENAKLLNAGGIALLASGMTVDQDVYWQKGFHARGVVRMHGAHIKGRLHCKGAHFGNSGHIAAELSGLRVDQDVSITGGSVVRGGIDLTGSNIGGKLDLTGGKFHHVGGIAVDLARADISQNMLCQSGFEIKGTMLLAGATIRGGLWCEGGNFDNPNDAAIDATGLTVGRDVKFSRQQPRGDGFLAKGTIILSDANIGGSLDCVGGELIRPGGNALTAKGLTVTRDAVFGAGFSADGEVDLSDATIGGCLNGNGGRFTHRPTSLRCDRIEIKQSAKLGDSFYAEGEVSLCGAKITADLDLAGASLAPDNPRANALALRGAWVNGTLRMRLDPPPVAAIDLSRAKVGELDDRETTWPAIVYLDGFVYGTLPSDGPTVRSRLDWLARSPHYVPQLYLQLASVYRAAGSTKDSETVAIAGEEVRRTTQTGFAGRLKRVLGVLLKTTVQYGYRPLRVLWWLGGLEIGGIVLFQRLHDIGALKPKDASVPAFNPAVYTLDLLVPVFSLGQRAFWIPGSGAVWASAGFTVVGWVLAGCLAVGVGKIFKN